MFLFASSGGVCPMTVEEKGHRWCAEWVILSICIDSSGSRGHVQFKDKNVRNAKVGACVVRAVFFRASSQSSEHSVWLMVHVEKKRLLCWWPLSLIEWTHRGMWVFPLPCFLVFTFSCAIPPFFTYNRILHWCLLFLLLLGNGSFSKRDTRFPIWIDVQNAWYWHGRPFMILMAVDEKSAHQFFQFTMILFCIMYYIVYLSKSAFIHVSLIHFIIIFL